ncbi:MAG: hypothetical protein IT551_04960 [Novosphingobium sp.]|jgi:hypothetical protein|nr:hypothetical protein [Novosphingobium sp.]
MKIAAMFVSLAFLLAGCGNARIYAEGCAAPPDDWMTPRQGRSALSVLNVIDVSQADRIAWNGKPIPQSTFNDLLKHTSSLIPLPVTHIRFGPNVDCATVERLRHMVSNNLDCSYGMCAEGAGKWWMRGDALFDGQTSEPYDPDQSVVESKR